MCHLRKYIIHIIVIITTIIIVNYVYFWHTQVGLHVKQNTSIITVLLDSEVRVAHLELFTLWTSPIIQLLNNTWNTTSCAERIGTRSQWRE
jgi:hypothetical protein